MALSSITAICSASDTLPCDGPAKEKRNNNRLDVNRLCIRTTLLENVHPLARRLNASHACFLRALYCPMDLINRISRPPNLRPSYRLGNWKDRQNEQRGLSPRQSKRGS